MERDEWDLVAFKVAIDQHCSLIFHLCACGSEEDVLFPRWGWVGWRHRNVIRNVSLCLTVEVGKLWRVILSWGSSADVDRDLRFTC